MKLPALLLTALLAVSALAADRKESRPNFVFIYTDDQRWDAMGVVQREQGERGRFPWLKTPNLDRLAAEGVRFRNAFVVNALCAPSRATFLTGKYGHDNGVVNNHTPFPVDSVTHASLLRAAGYRTGYVGKWHMGNQRGQRPGFDYSASFIGQGKYVDCPVEVNGESTPTQGWIDDVSTDFALGFIKENRKRPFSLTLGFKTCHGPFEPAARHKDDYTGETARPVPNLDRPAIYRSGPAPARPANAGPRPTNLNMFRGITSIDDNIGRILAALDELKLAENTVVIFSSDNGYYLGEHGLGDKRSAYEESMRIPLVVRYPALKSRGKTLDQIALNVDLAPTLLDFAGVPVPKEMHGRSWRPLLEGKPATDWRKAFFYCYFYENNFAIPTVTAVRSEKAKLVRYPGHDEWTELFDVSRDPYELKNLIAEPAAADLKRELEAEYARQRDAIRFRIPEFADDPAKARMPAPAPPPAAALNAWVLEYRFDKDQADRVVDASGRNNHGTAHTAPVTDGRDGKKARQFDGSGYIGVPKSPSLNPAVPGWTVEVTFKSAKPDGIVAACGGQSYGYCLWLDQGKPAFTYMAQGKATTVTSSKTVTGEWVTVTARVTPDRKLLLTAGDAPPQMTRLPALIDREPNNGLELGADLGSPVLAGDPRPRLTGLIESFRVYSGTQP